MTFDISPETITREARGVRGRFGSDVWEQWITMPPVTQVKFLTRYGVPEYRAAAVVNELFVILRNEGF